MRIVWTLVLPLAVILDSIELSSQFDCLPNGAPIPGIPYCEPSPSSPDRYSPERSSPATSSPARSPPHARSSPHARFSPARSPPHSKSSSPARSPPPAIYHSSASSPPPAEPPLRLRSRSPLGRHSPSLLLRSLPPEELRLVRLSPNKNPNRIFELRRYTFPPNKPILLRNKRLCLNPVPPVEQTVLSTPNGDVFAIFEKSTKQTIFRGIFLPVISQGRRAKINIDSGAYKELTQAEIADSPIGNQHPIAKSFRVFRV